LRALGAPEGRRHADPTALVAADRHLDLARADQRARAGRRTARGVPHLVWVVHRAGGVRVAAARQAEILAMRLADDGAAGVENARVDRGVEGLPVAFQILSDVLHPSASNASTVIHTHL